MSLVTELQAERDACVRRINSQKSKIKNCERAYETLRTFKQCVERSKAGFDSVNSEKQKVLSAVSEISDTCRSAKKYAGGMGNTLSGIGARVVGVTYDALILSIGLKMSAYVSAIDEYEREIGFLESRLSQLDYDIKAAKQAETLLSTTGR